MSRKVSLDIKLDANSAKAFQQATSYMFRETPKDAGRVLLEASIAFTQAARNLTPKARKNAKREIVERKEPQQRKQYGVVIRSQGGGNQWQKKEHWFKPGAFANKAEVKRSKMAEVPNIGAAKNSWWGALKDAGKGGMADGKKLSGNKAIGPKLNPAREIVNAVGYIKKIAPAYEREALRKAAKTIAIKTEKAMRKRGFRK